MEECDLIILIYACYTITKYKEQIDMLNCTWVKKCKDYKNIKLILQMETFHTILVKDLLILV